MFAGEVVFVAAVIGICIRRRGSAKTCQRHGQILFFLYRRIYWTSTLIDVAAVGVQQIGILLISFPGDTSGFQ